MFNVIVTVTRHSLRTIRRFAIPERFNNREFTEKAAQQLTHTSYLDDRVSRIVTYVARTVEVHHV